MCCSTHEPELLATNNQSAMEAIRLLVGGEMLVHMAAPPDSRRNGRSFVHGNDRNRIDTGADNILYRCVPDPQGGVSRGNGI